MAEKYKRGTKLRVKSNAFGCGKDSIKKGDIVTFIMDSYDLAAGVAIVEKDGKQHYYPHFRLEAYEEKCECCGQVLPEGKHEFEWNDRNLFQSFGAKDGKTVASATQGCGTWEGKVNTSRGIKKSARFRTRQDAQKWCEKFYAEAVPL